jgi:selenide,water dikinase
MSDKPDLLSFSKASGCGCKIHPARLEEILNGLKPRTNPLLRVGNETRDDASVMAFPGGLLVQTADFFTPLVRDPSDFGRIAAANALSDVYAMGGKPLMANALLGWPADGLPDTWAGEMLEAAAALCDEAGVPLAGGHSIQIGEVVFGLSVTGTVAEENLKTNAGARPGDAIVLTKALGTGILAAAHKRMKLDEAGYDVLNRTAARLNREGAWLGETAAVHAMTDVTGFGLLGHLAEMTRGSGLQAEIFAEAIPVLTEARTLAAAGILPDNTWRNWNALEKEVDMQIADVNLFGILNDPQTNGGLLIAVDKTALPAVLDRLQQTAPEPRLIGFCTIGGSKPITVRNGSGGN